MTTTTPREGQLQKLLQAEEGQNGSGWPVVQPLENHSTLFCCPWIVCVPLPALAAFYLMNFSIAALAFLLIFGCIICGLPICCVRLWILTWSFRPFRWPTDLYEKILYLAHLISSTGRPIPVAGPEFMPVSGLLPRQDLKKGFLDFALFLQVPFADADEWGLSDEPTNLERYMSILPASEHFETFEKDESPIEFVMKQLSAIYPSIYQEWPDKLSDKALVRFCLHGLGAHRLDVEHRDGQKYWVVKTNALAGLPVLEGFERYGGDVYFDEAWNPVMILDNGLGPQRDDGVTETVVVRPNEGEKWERAKFRFRSSLFALVTLVDHLYDIHLQRANLFVTALREQMNADHPIRRFMAPFTYRTIGVNDNAFHNLIRKNALGLRCFALTEQGFGLALAAAPSLVNGAEAEAKKGGPILFRPEYVAYLKKKGIDTEYWRQSLQIYEIFHRFVQGYLACYYPKKEDLANDPEMGAMVRQYFYQLEMASPSMLGRPGPNVFEANTTTVEDTYTFYSQWLAQIMLYVTAGHEQAGAVEVYAQDVSWTAFRWVPGQRCGTKQTATATALLMSFTNMPMPKLLGGDWTHLFPSPKTGDPKGIFKTFQEELLKMADDCDAYNASATTRPFPECFPMYVNNPRLLELSVSL